MLVSDFSARRRYVWQWTMQKGKQACNLYEREKIPPVRLASPRLFECFQPTVLIERPGSVLW